MSAASRDALNAACDRLNDAVTKFRRDRRRALANTTIADVKSLSRVLARHAEYPWDAQARVAAAPISELLRELRQKRLEHRRDGRGDYVVALYRNLRVQRQLGWEFCIGQPSETGRVLGRYINELKGGTQ